jgi:hypothetical protein
MLGVATLFGATACKDPTNSTPESNDCKCPNGTEHPFGTQTPCCNGDDCNCTVRNLPLFNEIFVYTSTNYDNTNTEEVDFVNSQLELAFATLDPEYVVTLKGRQIPLTLRTNTIANINLIRGGSTGVVVYGKPMAISATDLKNALTAYFVYYPLSKLFNDAKNTVRMAYAQNKYQRTI